MKKYIISELLLESLLDAYYKYMCLDLQGDVEEWEKYKETLSHKNNADDLSCLEFLNLSIEEKLKEFGCIKDNNINSDFDQDWTVSRWIQKKCCQFYLTSI